MTAERIVAGLPRRTAGDLALLCFLALLLYPLLWPQAPLHTGDSPQYLEVARDLSDLRPSALHDRSPGYPLLLALAYVAPDPPRATFILSLTLHVASVWLLAILLHSTGASRRQLRLFGVLLLLPPLVEPAGHVMTENLAQFTLALGLRSLGLWLGRNRPWLLLPASAAFAYGALTRPAYQALALALALCLMALAAARLDPRLPMRRALAGGIALVCGTGLVVGGVSWANQRAFGYFGLVPMAGYHLSTRTMNLWERLPDEHAQVRDILLRARDAERTRRGGTHSGTQTIWQARSDLIEATGMSNQELSRYLLDINVDLIRRAPIEYLQEVAQSLALYWFPAAGELATMNRSGLRWTWALLHAVIVGVFFLQIVVLVGVGIFAWSRRAAGAPVRSLALRATPAQAATYLLAGTIVFYTMVLSCALDIGEVRQRRSTDVLVVLMVFVGAQVWSTARKPEAGSPGHES